MFLLTPTHLGVVYYFHLRPAIDLLTHFVMEDLDKIHRVGEE